MFNYAPHVHGFHSTAPQGTVSKLLCSSVIIIFRDTKPSRFQLQFRRYAIEKIACKTWNKWCSWPCFKFSSYSALCNLCTQKPTGWCWGIRISSHFHGSLKSCCHFQKTPTCQFSDIIVKRRLYTAKRLRANVYATRPHDVFSFCA